MVVFHAGAFVWLFPRAPPAAVGHFSALGYQKSNLSRNETGRRRASSRGSRRARPPPGASCPLFASRAKAPGWDRLFRVGTSSFGSAEANQALVWVQPRSPVSGAKQPAARCPAPASGLGGDGTSCGAHRCLRGAARTQMIFPGSAGAVESLQPRGPATGRWFVGFAGVGAAPSPRRSGWQRGGRAAASPPLASSGQGRGPWVFFCTQAAGFVP